LLSYKPHLGLLFPIALAAGGYWRTFFSAGVVAVLLAVASWFAFGGEPWAVFLPNIGRASHAFLSAGLADWSKLQTAFGLARTLGGSETLAWSVQIVLTLVAAAAVVVLWSSDTAYEIKAAVLATGVPLATPYLYLYDLAVLAVPLAFLFRLGRTRAFLPYELPAIGIACLLILIFIAPGMQSPIGFGAVLIVATLIARRVVAGRAFRSFGRNS
jgi:arabinofuranan 3-O-arabinosyltransferase